MLSFNLSISDPWHKDDFENLYSNSGMITKHKAWEFETYWYSRTLLDLSMSLTSRRDHAGFKMELGLFGFTACFQIYDTRHWDDENKCWENYKDQENECN